jgi:Flp pilus assembly protein TadD
MAAGEYQLALKAYYRAAAEHGLTVEVLTAIGSANLKLGRLTQAEGDFRAALEKDPNNLAALNNLGVLMMEKGQYAEARQTFRRAFALDSGHSDVIRENLRRALALMQKSSYPRPREASSFKLVPRGDGTYLLQSTK